jgi:hypothetical protein
VGAPFPLKVTSAVRVTPDTLPHQDLDPTKTPYEYPSAEKKKEHDKQKHSQAVRAR